MLIRTEEASQPLLRAALSGLVAASGLAACDSKSDADSKDDTKNHTQSLSDEELKALCSDMVKKAESEHSGSAGATSAQDLDAVCKDKVEEAKHSVTQPDVQTYCADAVKTATEAALAPKTAEEKTTSSEQKEYTFAALTKMCDDRGGYTQIHAACGGHNSCKGFSYGDWGPDAATFTEHSCTGVNGCLGLSCVVGLGNEGKYDAKTGKELYALEFGDTEPHACKGCHAEAIDGDHDKPDLGTFYVYVLPGSTRNTSNWLDVSAAEQERKVAFGVHYTDGHGREIQNMAGYNQVLSRKEIERLVAYIRTLKPILSTIKVTDP